MNSYSLSSDSPRWWWSSAFGGGLALTSVTVLGVLVGTNSAAAQSDFRDDPPVPQITTVVPMGDAPCFDHELTWDVALDGPVPTCDPPATAPPLGIVGTRLHVQPGGDEGYSVDRPTGFINQIRWNVARP